MEPKKKPTKTNQARNDGDRSFVNRGREETSHEPLLRDRKTGRFVKRYQPQSKASGSRRSSSPGVPARSSRQAKQQPSGSPSKAHSETTSTTSTSGSRREQTTRRSSSGRM